MGGAHEDPFLVKLATIQAANLPSNIDQMPVESFLVAHMSIYTINLDFGNNFIDKLFHFYHTPTLCLWNITVRYYNLG